tara:strand:+ start:4247 stop:4402 length:156 start_codon:yes stop_codon:yes gene_type:complete
MKRIPEDGTPCKCVKAEIDKDLAERTNWRLPRYKCKNCDMLWDNYRYNGGA